MTLATTEEKLRAKEYLEDQEVKIEKKIERANERLADLETQLTECRKALAIIKESLRADQA